MPTAEAVRVQLAGHTPHKSHLCRWKFANAVVNNQSVRYSTIMQKQTFTFGPHFSGVMLTSGRRSAPFMPGLLLIFLALVVLVAPKLVFGALAFVLLTLGLLMCYVAYRIIRFKRQVTEMAKDFEKRFSVQGFPLEKPDIDITDIDSKKIVFH